MRSAKHEAFMTQTDECAYYVYGITASGIDLGAIIGLEVEDPVGNVELVYAVPQGAIQAVVSRVPLASFGPTTFQAQIRVKDPVGNMAWLQDKVLGHERVVRSVFERHTIIPLKFGTLFETEEKVRAMLAARGADFRALLARLDGKEEWGVKVFADRARLREEIERGDDAIKNESAEIARKGAGAAYLLRQRLNEQIAARVEQALADAGDLAYMRLLHWAVEGVVLRPLPPEMTGVPGEMILNAAFLVAQDQAPTFLAYLASLKAMHAWWHVEHSGPWAPYNFLNLGAEQQNV